MEFVFSSFGFLYELKFVEGHISLQKILYTFGQNPFVFKKNPSKIHVSPFVLKKSCTLFQMSEVPLGVCFSNF